MGARASLEYLSEIGAYRIEQKVRKLVEYAHAVLPGLISPAEDWSGIVTIDLGSFERDSKLYHALRDNNIIASLRYMGGIGGVRLSLYLYNNEEHVDSVNAVISKLVS